MISQSGLRGRLMVTNWSIPVLSMYREGLRIVEARLSDLHSDQGRDNIDLGWGGELPF